MRSLLGHSELHGTKDTKVLFGSSLFLPFWHKEIQNDSPIQRRGVVRLILRARLHSRLYFDVSVDYYLKL